MFLNELQVFFRYPPGSAPAGQVTVGNSVADDAQALDGGQVV